MHVGDDESLRAYVEQLKDGGAGDSPHSGKRHDARPFRGADEVQSAFRIERALHVVDYEKVQTRSAQGLNNARATQLKKCIYGFFSPNQFFLQDVLHYFCLFR